MIISLVGCKQGDTSKINDIPEDGIVKTKVFKKVKESDDVIFFNGEDGKNYYQWMFRGSDIDAPEDLNLLINITDKNANEVKKQTESNIVQGFEFKETKDMKSLPALSIALDKSYDITSAEIYKYNKNHKDLIKVSSTTIKNSKKTIVNFTVKDREGEFYIAGYNPKKEKIESDNDTKSGQGLEENSIEDKLSSNSGNNQNASSKSNGRTGSIKNSSSKANFKTNKVCKPNNEGKPNKDGKDKYLTDPTPAGKPKPTEPEEINVDTNKKYNATLSIRCDTLLQPENYKVVTENGKVSMVPSDGVIYKKKQVVFNKGESVFDILQREVRDAGIHMEFEFTPMYNSAYIEGINNLYEFDGGELSGWMYKVNGWYPNYGCSRYVVKEGDVIEWTYTCDLGRDVGCDWLAGE